MSTSAWYFLGMASAIPIWIFGPAVFRAVYLFCYSSYFLLGNGGFGAWFRYLASPFTKKRT